MTEEAKKQNQKRNPRPFVVLKAGADKTWTEAHRPKNQKTGLAWCKANAKNGDRFWIVQESVAPKTATVKSEPVVTLA
jgi:hypothetical protein